MDSMNQWPGKSGTQYQYWNHPLGTTFKSTPGNYIHAKFAAAGSVPLYMGQMVDLAARLGNQEKES